MKAKTKAEREHLALVASLPCSVCGREGVHVHHLPRMGGRKNHFETIPLCPTCHVHGEYGVAIHQGRGAWEARNGTEKEHLAKTLSLLKLLNR